MSPDTKFAFHIVISPLSASTEVYFRGLIHEDKGFERQFIESSRSPVTKALFMRTKVLRGNSLKVHGLLSPNKFALKKFSPFVVGLIHEYKGFDSQFIESSMAPDTKFAFHSVISPLTASTEVYFRGGIQYENPDFEDYVLQLTQSWKHSAAAFFETYHFSLILNLIAQFINDLFSRTF
ncbi:hypothetical protein IEQ34_010213 [Dendrobium chrysotoxum]|uniref:Uncharacterized protein n=1 Tax=Dendrobium chrysotoxum TaxID=161865 RepID=A0AAV7H535_DENCH|nr:hypothetical protein IEQ34_010213 [Dendrobium chrysotoxum]